VTYNTNKPRESISMDYFIQNKLQDIIEEFV